MRIKSQYNLQDVVNVLSDKFQKAGDGYNITCPLSHNHTQGDNVPSCSVNFNQNHELLIHCQAGCEQMEVFKKALGKLKDAGMIENSLENVKPHRSHTETTKTSVEQVFSNVDISGKEDIKVLNYMKELNNWNVSSIKKHPNIKGFEKEENQKPFTDCMQELGMFEWLKASDELKVSNIAFNFLSFYLFEKQNLVCIDYDKIKDENENITELVLPKELNLKASDIEAYFCELSQSKKGVHVFLKVKQEAIKKVKNQTKPIEIYKEKKQISVTSCVNDEMIISPRVYLQEAQEIKSGLFTELDAKPMTSKRYDILGFIERIAYYTQGNFKVYIDNKNFHYCLYNEGYWKEGKTYALNLLVDISKKMLEEINYLEDVKDKEKLIKFINKTLNKSFKEDVLINLQSNNKLKISDDTFEKSTGENLFNISNKTYDFKRKCFREQTRNDFLTMKNELVYNENATCEKWNKYLNDVFLCDEALIHYVKKLIGYVITGRGNERLFIILNGKGKNGKSVFCEVLKKVLGCYAGTISKEAFTYNKYKNNEINSFLTQALEEKTRFLVASELTSLDVLDDALVKNISGNEAVTTRTLRSLPITLKPQFTVFCLTNNLPRIKDYSKGMWDRIKIIPFDACFGDEVGEKKENKHLKEELIEEASGILNWCIEGFLEYEKEGLEEPQRVKELIVTYKQDEDLYQQWIDENIQFKTGSTELVKVCFEDFKKFLEQQGITERVTQRKFTQTLLKQKNFKLSSFSSQTNSEYKKFSGVCLKHDVSEDEIRYNLRIVENDK